MFFARYCISSSRWIIVLPTNECFKETKRRVASTLTGVGRTRQRGNSHQQLLDRNSSSITVAVRILSNNAQCVAYENCLLQPDMLSAIRLRGLVKCVRNGEGRVAHAKGESQRTLFPQKKAILFSSSNTIRLPCRGDFSKEQQQLPMENDTQHYQI